MNSGTRAAQAATSRVAKQELVRLLFGKKYARTGTEGHRMLDYSIYSYEDLRKAYLGTLQEIHPDKKRFNGTVTDTDSSKQLFHDLQNAWDRYEELARASKKIRNGENKEANFTLFGVGCSFSDNDAERDLRSEITDQACRGWFSSGELPAKATSNVSKAIDTPIISLTDDDMFVEVRETQKTAAGPKSKKRRRHLIPGMK